MNPSTLSSLFISSDHILSQIINEDAAELFELVEGSRESLRQWLPWLDHDKSVEDQKKFIEIAVNKFVETGAMTAGIRFKDEIAGIVGFNQINWPDRNATIGYWLGEKFRGNGLMLKSCRKLIEHGFKELKLNKVSIHCAAENYPSRKIPESLGLTLEGKLRQANYLYDHFVDLNVYGILKEEWEPRSNTHA